MFTITTSWDDGHVLDLKLADMLARHGLPGTFYIPRSAEKPVMQTSAIRELASSFEVGGHTLSHINLGVAKPETAAAEIAGCRRWLEDVTGKTPGAFCPPGGRYSSTTVRLVAEAGFTCMRTVELLSCARPTHAAGIRIMGTSLQAYPHSARNYLRNIIRRGALRTLGTYVCLRPDNQSLFSSVQHMLARAEQLEGCFHLWGHSWEIEECALWPQLESVFELLGSFSKKARFLDNSEACEAACEYE